VLDLRVPALHQRVIELSTEERISPDRGGNLLSCQPHAIRDNGELLAGSRAVKEIRPDCSNGSTQPAHHLQVILCPGRGRKTTAADPGFDDVRLDTNALSGDVDVAQGHGRSWQLDPSGFFHGDAQKIQNLAGDHRRRPSMRGNDRVLYGDVHFVSEPRASICESESGRIRRPPNDQADLHSFAKPACAQR